MSRREGTFWLCLGALFVAIVLYTVGTALPADAGGHAQIGTAIHGAIHPETCRYSRSDGRRGWTAREIEYTIRCAVRRWPVYGGAAKAIAVARCESGLNERAISSSGTFRGVYQQHAGYWPGRYHVFAPDRFDLRPSVFNGRTNVVVSVRMAHVGGWSPWSCA